MRPLTSAPELRPLNSGEKSRPWCGSFGAEAEAAEGGSPPAPPPPPPPATAAAAGVGSSPPAAAAAASAAAAAATYSALGAPTATSSRYSPTGAPWSSGGASQRSAKCVGPACTLATGAGGAGTAASVRSTATGLQPGHVPASVVTR